MRRRAFVGGVAALAALPIAARAVAPPGESVRIGLTPVFLDDQMALIHAWQGYLEPRLGAPVRFAHRGSYREIVELLRQDKLDFAWVCGFPFVRARRSLRLVAVPVFRGRPLYRSYLVVPSSDTTTRTILDLRGKPFAYSDPDSNSGFLYPIYRLLSLQERPDAFFSKAFFTWAHRKVVEAVAHRVASGGAVDGYVWETLARFHPQLTARTRVADRSPEFGFPPFVARANLPSETTSEFRRVLVGMANEEEGRRFLQALNLDGFTPGSESLFDGIEQMLRVVARSSHARAS